MKLSNSIAILALLSASSTSAEKAWSTTSYEIWGSDQSNSVPNQDALGVAGSWLWIWDSSDIQKATEDAMMETGTDTAMTRSGGQTQPTPLTPKTCSPNKNVGPCDLFDIFPTNLTDSNTGEMLGDTSGVGRWHGVTKDPQNMYVTANIFAPGGGYLGVVDASTKEAVALFRVTSSSASK